LETQHETVRLGAFFFIVHSDRDCGRELVTLHNRVLSAQWGGLV
jgi:hypothetical protein